MISPVYKLVLYSETSGYVSVSAKWPEIDKIPLVLYLTLMIFSLTFPLWRSEKKPLTDSSDCIQASRPSDTCEHTKLMSHVHALQSHVVIIKYSLSTTTHVHVRIHMYVMNCIPVHVYTIYVLYLSIYSQGYLTHNGKVNLPRVQLILTGQHSNTYCVCVLV